MCFSLSFWPRTFTAFMTRAQKALNDTAALDETEWRSRKSVTSGTDLRRPGRSAVKVEELKGRDD